jgi:hypothetical protein
MKEILVLGATGKTGRLVVKELEMLKGIRQTAYVRTASKMKGVTDAPIKVIEGNVIDTEKLHKAMEGMDFVISCLGGDVLPMAKSIVEAMKGTSVSRVVWLTGRGIHNEVPGEEGEMLRGYLRRMPEFAQAADVIADSGVCYTLIRIPILLDGENKEYDLTNEDQVGRCSEVTRSAVAKFIADMVIDENGFGENGSIGITN